MPPEVPDPYREDFTEACKVLDLSPKASAALTRRCLQAILREKARTTRKDLNDQIEEIIGSKALPSYIADDLHAVRVIGNFAAHPLKSTNTGEVLELLFDFYFVGPAVSQKRKRELNQKLKEAGKPALK